MPDDSISRQILPVLPESLSRLLGEQVRWDDLEEIRLRLQQPVELRYRQRDVFLNQCVVTGEMLRITFQKISQYSAYACKEELQEGFMTLCGGHRVGLCGRMYREETGCRILRQITSMNIRIARQQMGCSDSFIHKLFDRDGFVDTLLISPPGFGKTTYLRDIIRSVSDGCRKRPGEHIAVVDERGEIGNRSAQTDGFYLGRRTDLLEYCPKAEGLLLLLRSMGPQILAADEIGSTEDIEALRYVRKCGCRLLMTVHGTGIDDVRQRPVLGEYLGQFPFSRYLLIRKMPDGHREAEVFDREGVQL